MKKTIAIIILIALIIILSFTFFIRENVNQARIYKLNQTMLEKERAYDLVLVDFIMDYDQLFKNYQLLFERMKAYEIESEYILYEENYQMFKITGYSLNDPAQGTTNIVKAGFNLDDKAARRLPIIAVDPAVVPLYSIVEIDGLGAFIALDTGGAIKDKHVEILFDSKKEALEFGVNHKWVRILK